MLVQLAVMDFSWCMISNKVKFILALIGHIPVSITQYRVSRNGIPSICKLIDISNGKQVHPNQSMI